MYDNVATPVSHRGGLGKCPSGNTGTSLSWSEQSIGSDSKKRILACSQERFLPGCFLAWVKFSLTATLT